MDKMTTGAFLGKHDFETEYLLNIEELLKVFIKLKPVYRPSMVRNASRVYF